MIRLQCQHVIAALSITILLATPTASLAQGQAFIGPQVGMQKAGDAEDPNYLIGGQLRLKLMPMLGAEGSISYRQEDYAGESVTVRNWPVQVTGLLYPLPPIYGGVGAGWYNTTFDYDDDFNELGIDDHTDQEFGWHLAAGIEIPASPRVKLVGDIRYVFLDYEFEDLPDVATEDVDADFYSITAGLLFRL